MSTEYRMKRLEDEHGGRYRIIECTQCNKSMGAEPSSSFELQQTVEAHHQQYHPGTEQFRIWAKAFQYHVDCLVTGERVRDLSRLGDRGLGRQLQTLSDQTGLGFRQDQMQMASQPIRYIETRG